MDITLNVPLSEVKPAWLRRTITSCLGFLSFSVFMIVGLCLGLYEGLCEGFYFWKKFIRECW